jgi:pimeloyl-ACP methyl ester carboxylesterase
MSTPDDLSRRQTLAILAASALSAVAATPAGAQPRRATSATFVLVHGAWHGGWCWTKLAPLLRAAGHQVFTPTLTGLGERAHQLGPEVDLATHVQDVAAVLEYEDLGDVILVGHSYGGMVIAGVASHAPDRVAQLVYLDAFLPEDGKAVRDYVQLAPARADGWRVPPPATPQQFGVTNERDAAWVAQRLGDQPLKTFTQPVHMPRSPAGSHQAFIQCTASPWFAEAAERSKRRGYRYHALLSAGHDAMLSQPKELAAILLALAERM